MIEIALDPNIVQIGGFTLTWHGFFSAVGLFVAIWIGLRLVRSLQPQVSEDDALSVALWGVIFGVIGARLFHVVDQWEHYASNPIQILAINEGGIAIYGAIVGGIVGGVGYILWKRLPLGPLADAGAAALVLGQAIGRVGDIINGEHHADPTELPWGVEYTHPRTLGEPGVIAHPAVAYELLWDMVVYAACVALIGRARSGVTFWVYVIGYAIGRFAISFTRHDALWLLGLRQAQIVAAAMFLLGVAGLLYLRSRGPLLRSRAGWVSQPAAGHGAEPS